MQQSRDEPNATQPPIAPILTGSARRIVVLDGVRGLAILIVLFHNTSWIEAGSSALPLKLIIAVASAGWTGVQLFFVLSGFLITGILVDALASPTFFQDFYIRRTLRIFPLYYAVLALTFFAVPHLAHIPFWSAQASKNQWWYWTYASNWGSPLGHGVPGLTHFWSLAVEEQFYVLWPALIFILGPRSLVGVCIVAIAATPLVRLVLHAAGLPPIATYEFTVARWDALAAGALLAILLRKERGRRWLQSQMRGVAWASLFALAVLVWLRHGLNGDDIPVQVVGQTLVATLSVCLIYFSVASPSGAARPLRRVLSADWLRFLGKYSYAIYVFHWPIHTIAALYAAETINSGNTGERLFKLAVYVISVSVLSVGAALISWHLVEKPFLDWKDRLAPRREGPPAIGTRSATRSA